MAKNAPPVLSDAQQEIMEIIWDRGEVSVSEVWDVLQQRRDIARRFRTVVGLNKPLDEFDHFGGRRFVSAL